MPNLISEDQIEKATIHLLTDTLGYRHINCYTDDHDNANDLSNREDKSEVVFFDILNEKAKSLNPTIPQSALNGAVTKLTNPRYAMSRTLANKEVYELIREGIPVEYEDTQGKTKTTYVNIIDFNDPGNNDFLAVSQLWIKGDHRYRRPDIILYVNGLPLIFIELKNSNTKLKTAYTRNLTHYKEDIPLLFMYNAVCILSNAVDTRVGSITSEWEHFFKWLRVDDEKEKLDNRRIQKEGTSIERIILGLCAKEKLLDYLENFILFRHDTTKLIAQNQQFLGVNNAIESFKNRDSKNGKLGVFWHTQGAGKSFSMIFFTRKIFRKFTGDFTFVVITDRDDLDGQIYRNFLYTGTVTEKDAARPKDSESMRKSLSRNLRIVFTLIHKFRWPKGKPYPLLTDRDDVIVMVDEAHRTQYKDLAENMRRGLPNAQYIAFTGTPLLGKDRKTNAWFGDYISEYNFAQSVEDGATVPLFYKKRVPEVLIQNENLSEEFYEILDDEELNDEQKAKLEKEYSKEIEVIKREDRLERIARDIVYHFPRRGYLGKGMVLSVDKFTSVKMCDKVQTHWKKDIKRLLGLIKITADEKEKQTLQKRLDYMRNLEMAVVISEEAGEEAKFDEEGLNIRPHRKKMKQLDDNGQDIEQRFKNPNDKFQLVFVCAMWMTGFDAPTVSTLYLDKPMKDHTLMQAITRANRVTPYKIDGVTKTNGELIDYYNVFRNMRRALADYALGSVPDSGNEDMPVQEKSALFKLLDDAINLGQAFCDNLGIKLASVLHMEKIFEKIRQFEQYADKLLESDTHKNEFIVYENTITSLYEACKPEVVDMEPRPLVPVFQYLRGIIDNLSKGHDLETTRRRVSELLDQSVVTKRDNLLLSMPTPKYEPQPIQEGRTWDLSKLNFEKLKEDFKVKEHKHIEISELRSFIERKLGQMIQRNLTRLDFAEKLQEIIDTYNSGGSSTENYYDELLGFTETLKKEEERHIRLGLTEDELELFDILKKEKITQDEEKIIKLAAKRLLRRLLQEKPKVLVQNWYKDSQSQAKVRTAVEEVLDKNLPKSYGKKIFQNKCNSIFELVYRHSSEGGKWAA